MKAPLVFLALPICVCACTSPTPALAGEEPSPGSASVAFEKTVDRLFAENYPQELEQFFCSLGDNPDLGFRLAGSPAEHATSERVAAEMRAMGLQNVRLESVPVDAYEFRHASLTVGDRIFTASTLDGTNPTPGAGFLAPLVYVKSGTAADFDSAGDVKGKLVLIDKRMKSWWFTPPALEATLRGAIGVICTGIPDDPLFYSVNDKALGGFASYDPEAVPWIYVAQCDGDWLKTELQRGPVVARMVLDATITPMDAGGVGYNVIGELPGEIHDDQQVVLVAHQDAHFRAGLDDTGALVAMLTAAKAMTTCGFRPAHRVVFLATTGEEYGRRGAYYDWSIGAWWAATRSHADWAGRVRGLINLEYMAFKGAPVQVNCDPSLKALVDDVLAARADLVPFGIKTRTWPSTWTDEWTFSAAGLPTIDIITHNREYNFNIYHTNFDTGEIMDWDYLGRMTKLIFAFSRRFDADPHPCRFDAQADEILARTSPEWMTGIGADTGLVTRWRQAVDALRAAALAFDETRATLLADQQPLADRRLLEITKVVNHGLASFAPRFDETTVYPHQQVLRDVTAVGDAIKALRAQPADPETALQKLTASTLTRIGLNFSPAVHAREIEKRTPGYARLHWGEQTQLPPPLDLVSACRLIQAGDTASAIAELEARRAELLVELNLRLAHVATTLEQAAAQLREPLE